jgi:hypothetical protein
MRMSPTYRQAFVACTMLGAICVLGCASSESSPNPGSGGAPGGSGGSVGSGGATPGSGGMMGSGGVIAASGGATGTDARDTADPMDVKVEMAAEAPADGPATFTELYMTVFGTPATMTSSCAGGGGNPCHNPGKSGTVDMSSKATAYTTLLATKVRAGNPAGSSLMTHLTSTNVQMRMPLNRPALSAALIARVRLWIMAGAKND